MKSNKRFVSWVAVSSIPQAKKISLTEQREINLRHIEQHDGKLIATLEVPGESRDIDLFEEARDSIEAYARLYELIRTRSFDVLICLTRSRLGRTLALIEGVAQKCRRAGIIIYETDTPPRSLSAEFSETDLLTGAVRSWGAQKESEELRRRNKMGMLGKFENGGFLSGVPWGWKAIYDAYGKLTVEVDLVAAYTIRTAFLALYVENGVGAHYMADELNKLGLKTAYGLPFTTKTTSNLFRMLWRYAGYSEINHYSRGHQRPYARAKGNWPAILTEEELERIQLERQSRRNKRGIGNANTYRYSLMVYCFYCKTRMCMTYQTRAGGRRVIFATCTNTSHKNRNILVPEIDAKLREFFAELQDVTKWPLFIEETGDGSEVIEDKIEELKGQVGKAEQNILKADDKLFDGTLDDVRHAHQVKRAKEQIQQYQHDITVLNERLTKIDHANHRLDRIREVAEKGMEYLAMEDERAANSLLRPLLRIWAKETKVYRIEFI